MNKIFYLFFFLVMSCVSINKKENSFNNNLLDLKKKYSFNEYIIDLKLLNKNQPYPDINDIPILNE